MIHLCGNGLGQKGSTLYTGTSCARALEPAANAQRQHRPIVTAVILEHLFQVCMECFPYLLGSSQLRRRSLAPAPGDINGELGRHIAEACKIQIRIVRLSL